MKIALIGAGSREFGPATLRDLLLSEAICARQPSIWLMDRNPDGLPVIEAYGRRIAGDLDRSVTLTATTDLEAALDGADFVVTAIEIRRYFYWAQDFHIPRKHGFRQIYGENGGPGGLFHALRNMGPLVHIARTMERFCPEGVLLNYANPLTRLCEALARLTSVRFVGLCHGVFQGMKQVSRLLDMPVEDLDARASGLNHFTWFQSLRHRRTGEDLYPRLREREREALWLAEWDEIALSRLLFRTFGLYPSPGTNHLGEYIGWAAPYLASSRLQFFYDPAEGHPWETGRVPTWVYNLEGEPTGLPLFPETPPATFFPDQATRPDPLEAPLRPSGELAIPIIEGLACGEAHHLDAVNVPNRGYVPGLPEGAVVEVSARVSGGELIPEAMPPLPDGVLGLLRPQTVISGLLVEAFAGQDRNKLLQAVLLEPTCPSYHQAVAVVDELCALQRDVLPPLA